MSLLFVQFNRVLTTLNRQTVELSQELATAERQMVRALLLCVCFFGFRSVLRVLGGARAY